MAVATIAPWARRSAQPFAVALCAFVVMAGTAGTAVASTGGPPRGGGTVTIGCGDVTGLVAAIRRANVTPATATTINLASGCRYVLRTAADGVNGLPTVQSSITVNGHDAIVARSRASRIPAFRIWAVGSKGTLALRRLTVTGGSAPAAGGILNKGTLRLYQTDVSSNSAAAGGDTGGGGIYSSGTLTMAASRVHHNVTRSRTGVASGGGIDNAGTARIYASRVDHNAVRSAGDAGIGGGISNEVGATLAMGFSQLTANSANSVTYAAGSAISNVGTATLTASRVTGNTGDSPRTGVGVIQNVGILTLTASLVSGNAVRGAGVAGGGVYTGGGLTVKLSIIIRNTATNTSPDPAASAAGGGIFAAGGSTTVTDSVIARNRAVRHGTGGGIFRLGAATVTLTRTLLTANSPDNCAPAGSIHGCSG